MNTHQKKPVPVEAYQYREDAANAPEIAAWCGGQVVNRLTRPLDLDSRTRVVQIATREGTMTAMPGDWVIREPNPVGDRKFYPVKPEIFAATYDEIETEETTA